MALILSKALLGRLRRHGEEEYPRECCGVLLGEPGGGEERTVRRVVPCANVHPGARESRYRIDPRELLRAQREARQDGLAIVGFYHSHPDHPARFSQADLAEAHWTGCSYVITSIEAGRAAATRSYLLCGGAQMFPFVEERKFVEERIETIADRAAPRESLP